MKTLKQIREEYDNKFTTQVVPEELMLEDKGIVHAAPSIRDMPSLLIFRRVSYRLYPSKQVVALYYSKLLDKYLSIPFGPGGNLNLSEAVITDTIEEQGSSATRYTERPTYESFKSKTKSLRKEKLDENPLLALGGAALRTTVGAGIKNLVKKGVKYLGKKALDATTGKDDSKKSEPDDSSVTHRGELLRDKPGAKVSSSWSKASDTNPVTRSKMQQAALKENKIIDIRKMVKEGIETKDLTINGRQVTLNTTMAKRILEVYDSVNTKNKKIVEGMLNEDLESFKKLLNFSIRN